MKLTVTEAARLLAVPEQEVYDWMRARGLPYVKVQDQRFIHRARLHEWAREHYVPLHPDVFEGAIGAGNVFGNELAEAFDKGGLTRLPMPASEHDGLRSLVAALRFPSSVDPDELQSFVAARRELGFVVDRQGVALPRLGEPILSTGAPALFLFAFEPDWELRAGRVSRLFVLVAPTVRVHQRLLAELDAMLHQPNFRAAVLRADTHAQLVQVARETAIPAPPLAAK